MEQIWKGMVRVLAAIGGAIAGSLGGWDSTLKVLVIMMAADYLSGLMVAAMGKSEKTEYGGLSSKVGFIGLGKKFLMLTAVLICTALDEAMGTPMCRDAACWFYIANEGISVLENLNLVGVPFPEKIKVLLGHKMEEANETEEDDTGGDANA